MITQHPVYVSLYTLYVSRRMEFGFVLVRHFTLYWNGTVRGRYTALDVAGEEGANIWRRV